MQRASTPEVLVTVVMSRYRGAKEKALVDSEWRKDADIKRGVHQVCQVLSLFFTVITKVITELAYDGVLKEMVCGTDFILISETRKAYSDEWREIF